MLFRELDDEEDVLLREEQIHSENFKRWFGDWEKAARAKAIRALESVPQESLASGETSESAYQKIKEATNEADGITVRFFNSAYKKIFKSDGLSEKVIPMLKKCFEKSLFAYSEADNKGGQARPDGSVHKAHPNISEFRNYIGKVEIDGQDHYVRFTVKVQKGQNGLHSYFVTDVDVYEKTASSLSVTNLHGARGTASGVVDAKLQQFFNDASSAEENSSKVVDENGKPKVVLHGTPNGDFYIFDSEKAGSNTDQGWLGTGFYFYGNAPEYASQYAGKNGRVLQVYLDIKHPYIASVEEFNRLAEANDPKTSREFREQLEDEGYDGVYYNGDLNEEWVAFRPEQIKSATENNGEFDPNNPDIRLREVLVEGGRLAITEEGGKWRVEGMSGEFGSRHGALDEWRERAAGNVVWYMSEDGKRWGVKTGEVTLSTPGGETMHSVDVTPEMRRSVLEQGQPLFQKPGEGELEAINERFNERLDELDADPNQKDRVLHLGHPGEFLLSGGIVDAEIQMEYDLFVRKSKEGYKHNHPFNRDDIKDLPKAINAPIAVFNSATTDDKVILTELKKDGHYFIVVIRAISMKRKGGVVLQLNNIETLYPKMERGIISWINNGLITAVDKEKALDWLSALQTHPETEQAKRELDDAAKVVKVFENPTVESEKSAQVNSLLRILKIREHFLNLHEQFKTIISMDKKKQTIDFDNWPEYDPSLDAPKTKDGRPGVCGKAIPTERTNSEKK